MKTITNTSYIKYLLLLAALLMSVALFAQEEEEETEKKFSFSGSVDAYFRTNFNGLNKEVPVIEAGDQIGTFLPAAPASSFANDPGFALGMVNLIAGYEGDKVGFVADLVFGPRGEDAVFGSPFGSPNIVNQLYVYWNVSEKTTLTFGNWNTFLGYEVISPVANFNYSTSYMFSYGPFSHAGLKADFDLGNDWTLMLAVMNPTDFTDINPFSEYSFGAQVGFAGQFLNFIYGNQATNEVLVDGVLTDTDIESLFQIDFTGGFDVTDAFFLGINATYQDTDGSGFYGAALYPQYTTSDTFAIGLRAEYFKELEDGGPVYGADVESIAVTLTGNVSIGDLKIIPELRLDSISEEVFLDSDLDPTDNLASFLLAAVYAF